MTPINDAHSEPDQTAKPKKLRFQLVTKAALKRLAILFIVLIALTITFVLYGTVMPGKSHRGPLPPATIAQQQLADELRTSVTILADATGGVGRVGNRSTFYPKRFAQAAAYIHDTLKSFGYSTITEIPVARGSPVPNFEVAIPGTTLPGEIVVVGAHYDAFQGTPGADDNASGVAAVLHLARTLRDTKPKRTIRLLFFVNEEPPAFWTPDMGSWVYAKRCRAANDNIVAMFSIESIGYYSDAPGSQKYPPPLSFLYPDTGNFIGFVSNLSSRPLNRRAITTFRATTTFPSEGANLPGWLHGVGWSDHWSFWKEGYSAIMITDTATFRNPHYHTPTDHPNTLDYDRMSRVVEGISAVVKAEASRP